MSLLIFEMANVNTETHLLYILHINLIYSAFNSFLVIAYGIRMDGCLIVGPSSYYKAQLIDQKF